MKVILILITLLAPDLCLSLEQINKIVVIHSYPEGGEWNKGLTKGIEDTLSNNKKKFDFTHILYDYETLKFKTSDDQNKRINEIISQINTTAPTYVVINDDEAIEKILPKLSSHKNIILNGINDVPIKTDWGKHNDISTRCGIIEHYPVTQTLKMISQMAPNIKSMSIITSQGDSSKIVANVFKNLDSNQLHNINLRKVSLESKWENWKKELLEMNKHDGVGWILVPYEVVDENGKAIPLHEMASWIRKHITIPLLGILSVHTKMGFLSAISVEPFGLGKQAAEIIARIEKGENCQSIGFEKSKYHNFEINIDEIKRFGFKVPDKFIGVAKFVKTESGISK
jgi:ABC-type uncharacterized transport system substrate-binding protein